MCGICGYLTPERSRETRRRVVSQMMAALQHRGPDDTGCYCDDDVALGHRRLSIIDLPGGKQPLSDERGMVWVVSNGEIYNFLSLRAELQAKGHVFRTRSDAEVIVHAYEEYGDDHVRRLEGMFAYALWDRARKRLFLCRDRLGKKPLYYLERPGELLFASEPKALLRHPAVRRELDPAALSQYLLLTYVPAPHTIFHGMRKLEPGQYAISHQGRLVTRRYWDFPTGPSTIRDQDEHSRLLLDHLRGAVKKRLVSDVPLGILLSGGLDSSAIALLMRELSPGVKTQAFSVGFEQSSFNELPYAQQVARMLDMEHHAVVFTPQRMTEILPAVVTLMDEPLADPSLFPTFLLAQFAKRMVTVVLGGEGGDELFCGYPTFLAALATPHYARLPSRLRRAVEALISAIPLSPRYGSLESLLKDFLAGAHHPPFLQSQMLLGAFSPEEQRRLLSPALREALRGSDPTGDLQASWDAHPAEHLLDRLIYQHWRYYLAERVLVKLDRASMASALEVRAPFLDHSFVEFAATIPPRHKLRWGKSKYILKRALRSQLPSAIVSRRKQGFGLPIGLWLRESLKPLLLEQLHPARLEAQGLFESGYVQRLVTEHVQGAQNHRTKLWTLLMYQLWCERYLDRHSC